MSTENRFFNKEAATWDDNPGRVKMANNIANAILDSVPLNPQMRVMDFGCGTGLVGLRLQPSVASLTAVDSSIGMLEVLNEKIASQNISNVRTLHLDIEKGDTLEGDYNLVVSSMTVHHIKETKSLLEQFYKIIVPQGYICIADLDSDQGHFHGNNDGVFHFGFDRDYISKLLKEVGFGNIKFRTAAEIVRFAPGGLRPFTIFLVTAQKI